MQWVMAETPPFPRRYHLEEDNFEELFGQGVRLKEITVEMTDDPVTREIERYLPWLPELGGSYLHGGSTSRHAPLGGLHTGHFKRGDKR